MIIKYFKQFFEYFNEERRPFIIYSGLSLTAALLELCGVALTYPFIMKILSDKPTNDWRTSPLLIGGVIILIFLLKNLFMIGFTYIQARYTNNFGIKVQRRFMRYFLGTTYQESSKISLAQKNKILGLLINNIMSNFIFRLLNLSVNIFIFCLIAGFLAVKFPAATVSAIIFGVLMLFIQNRIYKPYLEKTAQKISESVLLFNQASNDALLNMRAVKVSNNEKYFYDNYLNKLKKFYENDRKNSFVSAIPPYVTEPFAILLLFVILAVIITQQHLTPEELVASLALVGAAIFRLTPAISRIQVNLNGINSAIPMVKEFLDIYENLNIRNVPEIAQKEFEKFNDSLELKEINFGYTREKKVLNNFNLKIHKGEFVGIAGPSGAGKTTLVDIIAGLYKPDSGKILIDGKIQTKPLKIGYVPQEFILIKGNIRENVAFGNQVIDDERVIEVLKKAQLYDYIKDNYKEGIYAEPFVDSTGFSQGQKQRIAIARALYNEPDILILDEATSSLDIKTEAEICGVLEELKGKTTIIAITHRITPSRFVDRIVTV